MCQHHGVAPEFDRTRAERLEGFPQFHTFSSNVTAASRSPPPAQTTPGFLTIASALAANPQPPMLSGLAAVAIELLPKASTPSMLPVIRSYATIRPEVS